MNIIQNRPRTVLVVIAVLVVAVVILAILLFRANKALAPVAPPQNASGTANASASALPSSPSSASVPAGPSALPSGSPSPAKTTAGTSAKIPAGALTISLISPAPNTTWVIKQQNTIAWSNSAKVTGQIDLINATTKTLVGVILSQTGPDQMSYTWDARSVYLSRNSPSMKDVLPGSYLIRVSFDGNGLGSIMNGPVTIIN